MNPERSSGGNGWTEEKTGGLIGQLQVFVFLSSEDQISGQHKTLNSEENVASLFKTVLQVLSDTEEKQT